MLTSNTDNSRAQTQPEKQRRNSSINLPDDQWAWLDKEVAALGLRGRSVLIEKLVEAARSEQRGKGKDH